MTDPLLVEHETAIFNLILVVSTSRHPLQLLSAAVEDADDVAAIGFGQRSELLLQWVHPRTIQHAIRAIVHHAMASVVDEEESVTTLLERFIDLGAGLVDRNLKLLVARIFQKFDLRLKKFELEQA